MLKTHSILMLTLAMTLAFSAHAADANAKKKSKLNTNLYEQESSNTSIAGKVKAVREIQGDTEVFIDNPKGNSGPYVLPANIANRAKLLKALHNSQKTGGGAVTISIDSQDRIKSVEESGGSEDSQTNKDLDF